MSATVVVIGVLLVPAALVGLVAGPVAAGAFPFSAIGGLAAAIGDGRKVALRMLPLASLGGAVYTDIGTQPGICLTTPRTASQGTEVRVTAVKTIPRFGGSCLLAVNCSKLGG